LFNKIPFQRTQAQVLAIKTRSVIKESIMEKSKKKRKKKSRAKRYETKNLRNETKKKNVFQTLD
jgi:hypothetical protein